MALGINDPITHPDFAARAYRIELGKDLYVVDLICNNETHSYVPVVSNGINSVMSFTWLEASVLRSLWIKSLPHCEIF